MARICPASPAPDDLARHDLHAVAPARAACDAADAHAVVVHGGDRAGDVRAVHQFGREIQFAGLFGEVVAVNVIHIAVAVVVDARRAVQFGLVDPHVGGQVFVVVLDALVHDGDDHVGIARRELPGSVYVGVGAQLARLREDVSRVVVVPLHLLRAFALVEREGDVAHLVCDGAGDALRPGGGRCRAAVVRSFGGQRVFDDFDVLARREQAGHLARRDRRVVFGVIPEVQAFPAGAFFETPAVREEPFETYGVHRVEDAVDLVDAAAFRNALRAALFHDAGGLGLQFEDDLAADGRRGGVDDDGTRGLFAAALRVVLGARCRREDGCRQEKRFEWIFHRRSVFSVIPGCSVSVRNSRARRACNCTSWG